MAKVSSKCLPSDAAAPLGAEAMTCMHPVSPPTATPPPRSKPAWTQTARKAGPCGVTPLLGIGVLGDASHPLARDTALECSQSQKQLLACSRMCARLPQSCLPDSETGCRLPLSSSGK